MIVSFFPAASNNHKAYIHSRQALLFMYRKTSQYGSQSSCVL